EQQVRWRHVADIGEVAVGAQVASLQQRRPGAAADLGKLASEVGDGKLRGLTRANMVEGTGADDIEVVAARDLVTDEIGGGLAGAVRAGRPQRAVLVEDLVRPHPGALDHPAAAGEVARPSPPAQNPLVQAPRGREVALPRRVGFLEGAADVRIAGEVINALGGDLAEDRLDLSGVAQVAGAQGDTAVEVARLVGPFSAAAETDDFVRTLSQ